MPVSRQQAEELRINVADVDEQTTNRKQAETEVDLERLAAQLRDLQRSSRQFINKQHANDSSYAASSSAYSDDGSQGNDSTGIDTPPTLAASSCPTPTRDSMPRTPSNLSQLTTYFQAPKSASGSARLRTGSPLGLESSSTADLSVPATIPEDGRPSIPQIPHVHQQPKSRLSLAASVVADEPQAEAGAESRPRSSSLIIPASDSPTSSRPRSSSLPEVIDYEHLTNWFQTRDHERDLIVPVTHTNAGLEEEAYVKPEDEIEQIGDEVPPTEAKATRKKLQKRRRPGKTPSEKVSPLGGSQESDTSIWSRAKESFVSTYCPSEAPPLILPSGPSDFEKTLYLKTNRLGLYTFGVFSFLSLSVGMWLFVISFVGFYWFGALVFLLQLYLVISYTVSICGKDYDFEKHKKILEEHPVNPLTAPSVDIYLPCCKEPIEVLENTYRYVKQLVYPQDKLRVYVLDDGASDAVHAMATQYGYEYICREDRPRLKKAGNLRWAFARTEGDFFAIFDADFCPRPDFLQEIIPIHQAKPDTAIVQTPQFFRTSADQSWVEQGAGGVQELFYRVVQVNRNRFGASICVGSNAVYRRAALEEVGGTAEIGFSEDVHTGFYAVNRGWKVRYLPLCLACGICPDTPRAFFSQQMRWCMGSTTLLTNMDFWRSKLNPVQKICYLSGMMYYSAISLSIFINPLPGILMLWIRPQYVRYYNLAFAVPSIVYSIIAIRCWAKARYGFNVQFIMVIQSYAYLTAIKDRLFGRALAWVPSGDTKAHKNNKYRNMRILAWCWSITTVGAVIAGTVYQILRGLPWYDCLPLIVLMLFNLFLAHRFLFWSGKI
ncbi:putative glycosyltransferase 2, nucleotide-diphospho-sugar transferase [Septoria linicola]|nr:putative glycosyltransferase 2, nucleotide-diphospho-sugar transferase [Septoria linicola]